MTRSSFAYRDERGLRASIGRRDHTQPDIEERAMTIDAESYWAIVELMGHRQRAGLCREVEQFGAKMLRIDIPTEGDPQFVTEFYGGSSIYALRPAEEDVARSVAARLGDPRPVAPVSYRLPAPPVADPGDEYLGDEDEDDQVEF